MKQIEKSIENGVEKMDRDVKNLAPFFYAQVKAAIDECAAAGMPLWIVEAYRSPKRQNWLYAAGRTRGGVIVTEARAWQSMHQYGLAIDVCGGTNKKPIWAMPWDKIKTIFEKHGLESLAPYEQSHFEIRCGLKTADLFELAHSDGLEAVWSKVESTWLNKRQ
jgi:peptidoglycan L-alanyl-D-glutamate endopeptidase CwlK